MWGRGARSAGAWLDHRGFLDAAVTSGAIGPEATEAAVSTRGCGTDRSPGVEPGRARRPSHGSATPHAT